MAERLDPNGSGVRVGDLVLRTPGFAGVAELTGGWQPLGTRSAEPGDDILGPALGGADVEVQHEVLLTDLERLPGGGPGEVTRSAAGEPAIELEVPDVAEGWEQMVLATDAEGIGTWHFAPAPDAAHQVRGTGTRTYRVRAAPPRLTAPGEPVQRGIFGAAGRALVRVLAFRVLDAALDAAGGYLAGHWERAHRPYRVRTFTPEDYAGPDAAPVDWSKLGGGRALLLLHGTFSRAHTGFGTLPRAAVERLHRRYEGRVLAFDHFTLSEDPQRNVERLVAELPERARLELDILCHSRGGLVARTLAELQSAVSLGSRTLAVERVVFAGTPNAGTVLADFAHLGDLIDAYTTLLSFVPDNGVTDVLEVIVTVAKTLAVGVLKGLDGLAAMTPGGRFLATLNDGAGAGGATYFALASDYEPTTPSLRAWARDRLTDALFGAAGNDLVVPAAGVYAANGSGRFPIVDRHVFGPADGVAHSGYFADPTGTAKLLGWLGA